MTGLIMLALKLKLIQPVDPLFVLCLLLPNCSPTAINIQVPGHLTHVPVCLGSGWGRDVGGWGAPEHGCVGY